MLLSYNAPAVNDQLCAQGHKRRQHFKIERGQMLSKKGRLCKLQVGTLLLFWKKGGWGSLAPTSKLRKGTNRCLVLFEKGKITVLRNCCLVIVQKLGSSKIVLVTFSI